MRSIKKVLAGLALALGLPATASAVETVQLTTVSGYPTTAAWVKIFEEVYVPAVNAELEKDGQYKINWTYGWGGAIVGPRGELEALETGLADIGIVQTVFHPDKLDIYNVAYATPFTTTDIDLLTRTVNSLAEKYPAMQKVWEDNNQRMLTVLSGVDNYLMLLRKPVTSIDGLSGLKIGGAGLNLRYLEGVGAVGVTTPLPDVYNNLSTGMLDGTTIWPEAMRNFKLYEPAPNLLVTNFGGVNSMALSVNADKWASLPAPVQAALQNNADVYRAALARFAMETSQSSIQSMKDAGVNIIELSDEERRRWAEAMPNVAKIWSESVDALGQPGSEVLADYLRIMAEAGHVSLRDWTK